MKVKFIADGQIRTETGNHLVITSHHANCCEMCLRWQGQILIDDVYSNGSHPHVNRNPSKVFGI